MVWEKHGDWHLDGSPNALRLGEAIPPGGLVTADMEGPAHSIVILLPDGQRMLCECYEAKTCFQGCRVPDHSAAPARGLGHVCRVSETSCCCGRLRLRPLSPPQQGEASMADQR